MHIENQI